MTSRSGSHFCSSCPVVVFDIKALDESATIGFGGKNIGYFVKGILDFNAIPADKKHMAIGTTENPTPLVSFLPDLSSKVRHEETAVAPKVGRNEICTCGSGLRFKKCCGK
jgi:hypothetical protein